MEGEEGEAKIIDVGLSMVGIMGDGVTFATAILSSSERLDGISFSCMIREMDQ